jgi:hypothetical protein
MNAVVKQSPEDPDAVRVRCLCLIRLEVQRLQSILFTSQSMTVFAIDDCAYGSHNSSVVLTVCCTFS